MTEIYPVACPICGESQNTLPGGFEPYSASFGPVNCMVCNHQFSKPEYLAGLEARKQFLDSLTEPLPE